MRSGRNRDQWIRCSSFMRYRVTWQMSGKLSLVLLSLRLPFVLADHYLTSTPIELVAVPQGSGES